MENTAAVDIQEDVYVKHSLSTILPEMSDRDFKSLKSSISEKGFMPEFPIYLYEGRILDGGHRYRAATEVGVTPIFKEFSGTEMQALAFILTANVSRRHLSKREIAQTIVNAESLKPESKRATKQQIASAADVGRDTVSQAIKLREKDPEGAEAVARGYPARKTDLKAGLTSEVKPTPRISRDSAETPKAVGARVVSVNIPIGLYNSIASAANPRGLTVNQAIKEALNQWVEASSRLV